MLLPNPLALAGAKVIAYAVFGREVARRAQPTNRVRPILSPLAFSVVRVLAGCVLGIPFLIILSRTWGEGTTDLQAYLPLVALRFFIWAVLLSFWYRPRGAGPTLLWAIGGTALSTALDLAFSEASSHFSILQMGRWC
jgi:ABC-type sugar transport system permease subunit